MKKNTLLAQDFQSLSLFRILFSLYLFFDFFVNVLPYYGDFFTDEGLFPRAFLAGWQRMSILMLSDAPLFHACFILTHVLAIIAFGLGYRTRLANLVLCITFTSMYWRQVPMLGGMELTARLLLLWSLFLPMSRYWAIDAALDPQPRNRPYPTIPFLALKAQICMIYLFAALYKIADPAWMSGAAVAMSLGDNMFGGTSQGLYLVQAVPELLRYATYGVILFQLGFSPLVYFPYCNTLTRGMALGIAALMHLSFFVFLHVGWFPIISLMYLVLLVPDEWWNALFHKRRQELGTIGIYFDPDCGFCKKTALLLREFCLPHIVPVLPADQNSEALLLLRAHHSWVVFDTEGNALLKWHAVAYVLKRSPVLFPLGWVTDRRFLHSPMEKLYDGIGAHRKLYGRLFSFLFPFKVQPGMGKAAQGLCALLMILALGSNLLQMWKPAIKSAWVQDTAQALSVKTPPWAETLFISLQVWQAWPVFAPDYHTVQRDFIFTGHLADGRTVDLLRYLPPIARLNNGYSLRFVNHRWQKYFSRLDHNTEGNARFMLARYLCRVANPDRAAPTPAVREVQLDFYHRKGFNPANITKAWPTEDTKPERSKHYACTQFVPVTHEP